MEKAAKRRFARKLLIAVLFVGVFVSILLFYSAASNAQITIHIPPYTNRNSTVVRIDVNTSFDALYARGPTDREWVDITNSRELVITQNGIVTARAVLGTWTSSAGNVSYIEVDALRFVEPFDRVRPTLTVTNVSGNDILITARDDMSGIRNIFINDRIYSAQDFESANSDNTMVTLRYRHNGRDELIIIAEDYAGNLSREFVISGSSQNVSNQQSRPGQDYEI